jgi:hypothetical protein
MTDKGPRKQRFAIPHSAVPRAPGERAVGRNPCGLSPQWRAFCDLASGGMMKQMIPGAGSAWMPYVLVKDIDAATKKAKKLRAKVMKGVTKVEGMGWLSIIVDPTGAVLGLWEPKDM